MRKVVMMLSIEHRWLTKLLFWLFWLEAKDRLLMSHQRSIRTKQAWNHVSNRLIKLFKMSLNHIGCMVNLSIIQIIKLPKSIKTNKKQREGSLIDLFNQILSFNMRFSSLTFKSLLLGSGLIIMNAFRTRHN